MGKRGPPKKPTALKKRQGTYRKDRAPKREVEPGGGVPECPDYLKGDARKHWERHAERLHGLGILTELDADRFAIVCELWAEVRATKRALDRAGRVMKVGKTNYQQTRPQVTNYRAAIKAYEQASDKFGMTPAARAGLEVDRPSEKDDTLAFLLSVPGATGPKLVKDEAKKRKGRA